MVMIQVTVDGERREDDVEPRLLLVHYLRERVGKVGTPVGCDTSNCGSCTVQLDGQSGEELQRAGSAGRRRRHRHHRRARQR